MDSFFNKVMLSANKIGSQRHLLAVRDAFIGIISVTMIGSLATLWNNIGLSPGFGWWESLLKTVFGDGYKALGGNIWWGTLAFITIFVVFGIAHNLAKSYGDTGYEAMFVAAACFFISIPQAPLVTLALESGEEVSANAWGFVNWGYLSSTGLFTGIIISLLSTQLFLTLTRVKKLEIKMPEGVPPEVARAFAKLAPGMITIFTFGVILQLIQMFAAKPLNDLISDVLVTPLVGAVDSLWFLLLLVFVVHFFWFFGLHGTNIVAGIWTPLATTLGVANTALFEKGVAVTIGKDGYSIIGGAFLDAFVYLGGSGATIGMIIAMIIFARKRRAVLISLAGPTGIFQINEPIIFGLPIVLNPLWFFPFVLTPLILATISFIAIKIGIVYPIVASIPWVTPPILGAFVATGGHISGAILALFNVFVSIVIYAPFVVYADRQEVKRLKEEEKRGISVRG